jgi:DNA-binding protein YbaB
MNVQNISSLPKYLSNFINTNHEQLDNIYKESREQVGPGILSFKVDGSDNRVDVKYMPDEELLQSMDREALEGLYRQAKQNGDKKIYLIEDKGKSAMFIVYI